MATISDDGYQALIHQASQRMMDDDWIPVLLGEEGKRYFAYEVATRSPLEAQDEALRLAKAAGAGVEGLYVLHRVSDRVDLHLPGRQEPGGEWLPERSYASPLFSGPWWGGEVRLAVGPRQRLSHLAERSLALSTP